MSLYFSASVSYRSLDSQLVIVTLLCSFARVTSRFSCVITAGLLERNVRHCSLSYQPSIATGTMPSFVTSLEVYSPYDLACVVIVRLGERVQVGGNIAGVCVLIFYAVKVVRLDVFHQCKLAVDLLVDDGLHRHPYVLGGENVRSAFFVIVTVSLTRTGSSPASGRVTFARTLFILTYLVLLLSMVREYSFPSSA